MLFRSNSQCGLADESHITLSTLANGDLQAQIPITFFGQHSYHLYMAANYHTTPAGSSNPDYIRLLTNGHDWVDMGAYTVTGGSGGGTSLYNAVFGTGVISYSGTTPVGGSPGTGDSHWTLIGQPPGAACTSSNTAYIGTTTPPAWTPGATGAQWIAPNANASTSCPGGTYVYEQTVNLTGYTLNGAAINGWFAGDDQVTLKLIHRVGGTDTVVTQFAGTSYYCPSLGLGINAAFCGLSSFSIGGSSLSADASNVLRLEVSNGAATTGAYLEINPTLLSQGSLALAASSATIQVTSGGAAVPLTVTLTPSNGFRGGVNLGLSTSMPTGVTVAPSPIPPVYVGATAVQAPLSFQASSSAQAVSNLGFSLTGSPATPVSMSLTVASGGTTVTVAPAAATLGLSQFQDFTATVTPSGQAVTWALTSGLGTISTTSGPTTRYTAPTQATSATLTATAGGGSATVTIGVGQCGIAPTATTVPSGGGTFSVMVTCPGVNWTVQDTTAGTKWLTIVSPAPDGSGIGHATGNASVTFSAPANFTGDRSGTLLIAGWNELISQASTLQLNVILPATAYLYGGAVQQFDAQFTAPNGQQTINDSLPTWTTTAGTISTGLFTMPPEGSAPASVTITATYNGQTKTATVTHQYFNPPAGIQIQTGSGSEGSGYAGNFTFWETYTGTIPSWTLGLTPSGTSPNSNNCLFQVQGTNAGAVVLTLDDGISNAGGYPACSSATNCNGAAPTLANSRCSINLGQSGKWLSGGQFFENLLIGFLPTSYGTNRQIWGSDGAGMPWTQIGNWSVPPYRTPSGYLDQPSNGQTLSGTATVAGWTLDNTTHYEGLIAKVEFYVDDALIQTQTSFTPRPDVCSAFPAVSPCPANLGFGFTWNTRTVANGGHVVKIIATDSDPTPKTVTFQATVQVSN